MLPKQKIVPRNTIIPLPNPQNSPSRIKQQKENKKKKRITPQQSIKQKISQIATSVDDQGTFMFSFWRHSKKSKSTKQFCQCVADFDSLTTLNVILFVLPNKVSSLIAVTVRILSSTTCTASKTSLPNSSSIN